MPFGPHRSEGAAYDGNSRKNQAVLSDSVEAASFPIETEY